MTPPQIPQLPDTPVYNKKPQRVCPEHRQKVQGGTGHPHRGVYGHLSRIRRGLTAAVASLGTALTPDHAQLLSRYFPQAILAYDGDGAGVAAAQRQPSPCWKRQGLKVRVLRMRGAKDPDEFIKAYGPGRLSASAGPE